MKKTVTIWKITTLFLPVMLFAAVCSSNNNSTVQPAEISEHPQGNPPEPVNEEIISGIETTSSIKSPMIPGETVPKSEDVADMLQFAKQAHKKGNYEEAIAFADALLLQNSENLEVREFRGLAFLKTGNSEAGDKDLEICCKAGRKSCCR